jgi:hypothetical protein
MAEKYRFFHFYTFLPYCLKQLAASSPFWIEIRGVYVVISLEGDGGNYVL